MSSATTSRAWGGRLDWYVGPFARVEWNSGESLSGYLQHGRSFVDEAFDLADRLPVPVETAVALDPGFADAFAVLAQVSAQRGADVDRVRGLMRRAVELEPGLFGHRLTTARLLLLCGQVEEARDLGGRLACRWPLRRGTPRCTVVPRVAELARGRSGPGHPRPRPHPGNPVRLGQRSRLPAARRPQAGGRGRGRGSRPGRAPLREGVRERPFRSLRARRLGLRAGGGVTRDATRTLTFYERACEGGDLFSCGRLGWLLAEGQLVGKDEAKGLVLSVRACDGGQFSACNTVGVVHMRRREYARAAAPFSKSCEGGEAAGCGNLALLHEQGLGVPRDLPGAVALHGKACDAGLASSCERLKAVRRP